MTNITLLEQLKLFAVDTIKDIILPVRLQKGDTEQQSRAADVYLMRLPDSTAATKRARILSTSLSPARIPSLPGGRNPAAVWCALYFASTAMMSRKGRCTCSISWSGCGSGCCSRSSSANSTSWIWRPGWKCSSIRRTQPRIMQGKCPPPGKCHL